MGLYVHSADYEYTVFVSFSFILPTTGSRRWDYLEQQCVWRHCAHTCVPGLTTFQFQDKTFERCGAVRCGAVRCGAVRGASHPPLRERERDRGR